MLTGEEPLTCSLGDSVLCVPHSLTLQLLVEDGVWEEDREFIHPRFL